jgi:hypothetical protein
MSVALTMLSETAAWYAKSRREYTLILLRRHWPHALLTWCRALDVCFGGLVVGITATSVSPGIVSRLCK